MKTTFSDTVSLTLTPPPCQCSDRSNAPRISAASCHLGIFAPTRLFAGVKSNT